MGFFSWKCAKTGLPIIAGTGARVGNRPDGSDVVLISRHSDGMTWVDNQGRYTGYGRLEDAVDVEDEDLQHDLGRDRTRLVLAGFYDQGSDRWDDMRANESDPGQGFCYDSKFDGRAYGQAYGAWRERDEKPLRPGVVHGVHAPLATWWFHRMNAMYEKLQSEALVQVVAAVSPGWREHLADEVSRIRAGMPEPKRDWGRELSMGDRIMGAVHGALQAMGDLNRDLGAGSTHRLAESLARMSQKLKVGSGGVDLPDPGWMAPAVVMVGGLEKTAEMLGAMARDVVFERWEKATGEALEAAGHQEWWRIPVGAVPGWVEEEGPLEVGGLIQANG